MATKELPRISWRGQTYSVDARLSRLCNTRDVSDVVDFKTFQDICTATVRKGASANGLDEEAANTILAANAFVRALEPQEPDPDPLEVLHKRMKRLQRDKDGHQQQQE